MINYDDFLSTTGRHLHESAIRRMGTMGVSVPDLVSFAAGFPDPALFPWNDLREIANELLSGADPTVLQYGATRGYRPLLQSIVEVLAGRGIRSSEDELIVTSGSQQGLDLGVRVDKFPVLGLKVEEGRHFERCGRDGKLCEPGPRGRTLEAVVGE